MDSSVLSNLISLSDYNPVLKDILIDVGFGLKILTIEIVKNKSKLFLIPTCYRSRNDPMETLYKFENCQ